jgi:histidinol-phosphatase (PHP family)
MMRFDQHLHSRHSFDCDADPEDNVRRAIDLGLGGLTFTEHFDTHPDEWPHCRYDDERVSADLAGLRDKYGHQLFIGKGIEVCYQPEQEAFLLDYLAGHTFDLVILSVHWTRRFALHHHEEWADLDSTAAVRAYLEAVREAAGWARDLARQHGPVFHVLGHLDLVRRYTHRYLGDHAPEAGGDIVDDILRTCLEAELVPEVNTSAIRAGAGRPMPDGPVIARYAALGGQAVTLGSDAHHPEHIAADFDTAVAMVKAGGIHRQAVFRDRRVLIVDLD